MKDPTKEEMIEFLKSEWEWAGIEDLSSEIEIAIYQFATSYHSGQWSNLYSALSTSDFNPGPMWKFDNEDIAKDLYDSLISEYVLKELKPHG